MSCFKTFVSAVTMLLSLPLIGSMDSNLGAIHFLYSEDLVAYTCSGQLGFDCQFPNDCRIGETVMVNCTSRKHCPNPITKVNVEAVCRFCWQLPESDYDCDPIANCSVTDPKLILTICTTHERVVCLGQRKFYKRARCNWSSGYSWAKTMIISVVLGGFGADRFYLGLWKSAVGKLFSFGGLGVWTIVDVVLIAVGYIKPYDDSLYI